MKRDIKILLLTGLGILIFLTIIAVLFFHFFNIANIVSGNG